MCLWQSHAIWSSPSFFLSFFVFVLLWQISVEEVPFFLCLCSFMTDFCWGGLLSLSLFFYDRFLLRRSPSFFVFVLLWQISVEEVSFFLCLCSFITDFCWGEHWLVPAWTTVSCRGFHCVSSNNRCEMVITSVKWMLTDCMVKPIYNIYLISMVGNVFGKVITSLWSVSTADC